MWLGVRTEFWWQLEQLAGRLWDHWANTDEKYVNGYWFDPVPAFLYVKRKQAERRHYAKKRN